MSTDGWKDCLMTVGQLRAALEGLDGDLPVILEKDAEGNAYSPLNSVQTGCRYEPDSTWAGEVYSPPEEDEVDAYWPEDGTDVVVLGPVN